VKMKMRHDHLVPLATQTVEILRGLERMTGEGKYVFPSIRSADRCMSENTVSAALRSMGYPKEVMTVNFASYRSHQTQNSAAVRADNGCDKLTVPARGIPRLLGARVGVVSRV
jgi:integrase